MQCGVNVICPAMISSHHHHHSVHSLQSRRMHPKDHNNSGMVLHCFQIYTQANLISMSTMLPLIFLPLLTRQLPTKIQSDHLPRQILLLLLSHYNQSASLSHTPPPPPPPALTTAPPPPLPLPPPSSLLGIVSGKKQIKGEEGMFSSTSGGETGSECIEVL